MRLILTSDWHIRSTIPICRIDNFLEIQEKILKFIAKIAKENDARLIIAGDIFKKSRPENSQELEIMLGRIFKDIEVDYIAGNHELLYHRIENFNKGSIGVLKNFQNWNYLNVNDIPKRIDLNLVGFSYGEEIIFKQNIINILSICILHKYIAEKELPFFMKDGLTAKELCETYDYEYFITGDNHHGFIYKHPKTGQTVINPGCTTRQESTFKNYKPRVYLLDTETKKIETIYLPDNDPLAIQESYEENIKERESRIDSFIEKLKDVENFDLDFEKNIDFYCLQNQVDCEIKEILEECIR